MLATSFPPRLYGFRWEEPRLAPSMAQAQLLRSCCCLFYRVLRSLGIRVTCCGDLLFVFIVEIVKRTVVKACHALISITNAKRFVSRVLLVNILGVLVQRQD